MQYTPQIWNQLKNTTVEELIRALEKDAWVKDVTRGAVLVYRNPTGNRVTIHYHPGKTYGTKLLKALINDIGWDEKDLKRLKLIK